MEQARRSPSHRRGAAVHRAVLQATTELLTVKGIANTRIADVATRAGVHETSIYRRWSSREQLIVEALSAHLDAELPLPDTGSTRADLTAYFNGLSAFLATPTGRSITSLALVPPPESAQFGDLRDRFWVARLSRARALVQRGVDRGDLPASTDPDLLLEALAGPLHFRILLREQPADSDYVTRLVELVLHGVHQRRVADR